MSRHVYHIKESAPFHASSLGSMQRCTKDELPILKNLSLQRFVLGPKAIREPHWQVNANTLNYCLSGNALVSVLDNGSQFGSFTISGGEMFHIKSGSLQYIENLSDTESAEFIVCVRHETPEQFSFAAAVGAMTPAVLGNAWGLPGAALANVRLSTEDRHILLREGSPTVPSNAHLPNPHKYGVEGTEPVVFAEGAGSNRPARSQFWPALENMSMYSLVIEDTGMREPHWHPFTSELGYVHRGSARMTILDPNGSMDTYTLKEGDMYYVPAAYPHQIEVVGSPDIHFLVFFDQPMPQDVGYKTSATAIQHEVMAATLGISRKNVPNIEGAVFDPLIVSRINDVDPVEPRAQL